MRSDYEGVDFKLVMFEKRNGWLCDCVWLQIEEYSCDEKGRLERKEFPLCLWIRSSSCRQVWPTEQELHPAHGNLLTTDDLNKVGRTSLYKNS